MLFFLTFYSSKNPEKKASQLPKKYLAVADIDNSNNKSAY